MRSGPSGHRTQVEIGSREGPVAGLLISHLASAVPRCPSRLRERPDLLHAVALRVARRGVAARSSRAAFPWYVVCFWPSSRLMLAKSDALRSPSLHLLLVVGRPVRHAVLGARALDPCVVLERVQRHAIRGREVARAV